MILLVLENHSYSEVIGSAAAPHLNALAQRYGLATQSYACCHPSLPNYLDLVSGSWFGIDSDCTACSVDGTTVADQVATAHAQWAAWMESMPAPCYPGASAAGLYAKKHDPFLYFAHIREHPALCRNVQPFSGFDAALDAQALPAFSLVAPNLCHDGHDCSLQQSDAWVGGFAARVTASRWFAAGGVLIVTYDEGSEDSGCCNGAAGGHIATLVVSRTTPAGARLAAPVDHAGVLRTVEELLHLALLGDAACTCSGDLMPLVGG